MAFYHGMTARLNARDARVQTRRSLVDGASQLMSSSLENADAFVDRSEVLLLMGGRLTGRLLNVLAILIISLYADIRGIV